MINFRTIIHGQLKIFQKILQWLCTIVGALVIVLLLIILFRSCYYEHKPASILYGTWEKVDSDDDYYGHTLTFDWDGKYYNSCTGDETWNYDFIAPDSLILYHHGLYEERYKILKLTADTLTVKMLEYIFYAEDNGMTIEHDYAGGKHPIYTYTHKSHSRSPQIL